MIPIDKIVINTKPTQLRPLSPHLLLKKKRKLSFSFLACSVSLFLPFNSTLTLHSYLPLPQNRQNCSDGWIGWSSNCIPFLSRLSPSCTSPLLHSSSLSQSLLPCTQIK